MNTVYIKKAGALLSVFFMYTLGSNIANSCGILIFKIHCSVFDIFYIIIPTTNRNVYVNKYNIYTSSRNNIYIKTYILESYLLLLPAVPLAMMPPSLTAFHSESALSVPATLVLMKWISLWVCFCISREVSNVEHVFMLIRSLSSLDKYVLKSIKTFYLTCLPTMSFLICIILPVSASPYHHNPY